MTPDGAGERLTPGEEDFLEWMEELDLEEVNLLAPGPRPAATAASDAFGQPAAPRSNQLDGAGKPEVLPARDTGWKVRES